MITAQTAHPQTQTFRTFHPKTDCYSNIRSALGFPAGRFPISSVTRILYVLRVSVRFHELGAEEIQERRENYILRSFVFCITKYYSGDQIKENVISWACGMHGGEVKYIQDIGWWELEGKRPLETPLD